MKKKSDVCACKKKSVWEISPVEYIRSMFERTDEEGRLSDPYFRENGRLPDEDLYVEGSPVRIFYDCKMNWTEADRDRVIDDFNKLYDSLSKIAKVYKILGDSEEENAYVLSPELVKVWSTYVRKCSFYDFEKYCKMLDKIDVIRDGRIFEQKKMLGIPLDDYEALILKEYENTCFSDEEEEKCAEETSALIEQTEKRLENEPMAFRLIQHSIWLCHLMSVKAPKCEINREARILAQAFAINSFAVKFRLMCVNTEKKLFTSVEKAGLENSFTFWTI